MKSPAPILLLMALLAASVLPGGAITLTLKPLFRAKDATFTVGNVVSSDPLLPAEIAALSLGATPKLNDHATLDRATVAAIVGNALAARPDLGPVAWDGAQTCYVERPARAVTPQSLSAALLPELQRVTGGKGQVKIEEFPSDAPILLPSGQVGAQVELPPTALLHPWITANITYYVDGQKALTAPVRFRWSWTCDAWQAIRTLSPGDEYNPADFHQITIDAIKADGNYLTELPPVEELVIARRVNNGAVLLSADLAPRKIVQRGETVTVNYVQPNFKVSMKAIALQDGARGQIISVKNNTSQRSLFAKVVGESTLEIVQ